MKQFLTKIILTLMLTSINTGCESDLIEISIDNDKIIAENQSFLVSFKNKTNKPVLLFLKNTEEIVYGNLPFYLVPHFSINGDSIISKRAVSTCDREGQKNKYEKFLKKMSKGRYHLISPAKSLVIKTKLNRYNLQQNSFVGQFDKSGLVTCSLSCTFDSTLAKKELSNSLKKLISSGQIILYHGTVHSDEFTVRFNEEIMIDN